MAPRNWFTKFHRDILVLSFTQVTACTEELTDSSPEFNLPRNKQNNIGPTPAKEI